MLTRLRSGFVDLNNYLFNIKKRDISYCDHCPNVRETVEHFALHCQNFNNIRQILFNELGILNVSPNIIGLKILLDGSDGPYKLRLKILNLFMDFINKSRRFDN